MYQYITNEAHYEQVLKHSFQARESLWIGTADIKDLHVSYKGSFVPYLKVLSELLGRGVMIRLIHAKEPGENFRRDFDKYPRVWKNMERMLCPRVHFKLIIIDMQLAYIGSANLTGAGIGAKTPKKRNFEAGIFTNNPQIVEQASGQFDEVWMGKFCRDCARRDYCADRVID